MKISKKRLALIRELETIIGNECYNANVQNWGPNGVAYRAGREFRYPITFTTEVDAATVKRRGSYDDLPAPDQMTGRYLFGSNALLIMGALNKVIEHLEEKHGLSV